MLLLSLQSLAQCVKQKGAHKTGRTRHKHTHARRPSRRRKDAHRGCEMSISQAQSKQTHRPDPPFFPLLLPPPFVPSFSVSRLPSPPSPPLSPVSIPFSSLFSSSLCSGDAMKPSCLPSEDESVESDGSVVESVVGFRHASRYVHARLTSRSQRSGAGCPKPTNHQAPIHDPPPPAESMDPRRSLAVVSQKKNQKRSEYPRKQIRRYIMRAKVR